MSIYKANDIRGVYGKELHDRDAYALGNAFVRFIKADRLIVGRDNRRSSRALHTALVKGIQDVGCDVLDLGEIDSPGFYFATQYLEAAGIMITASHNPACDNGFYVCLKNAIILNQENGLPRLQKLAQAKPQVRKKKGTSFPTPLMRAYARHVLSFIPQKKLRSMRIVIDAGNGIGAPIASRVFSHFKEIEMVPLYFTSDGRYPHHGPDPSKSENLEDLGKKVRAVKADFGVAFDGDADRAGFVDERGEPIEGSLIGALLAEYLLAKHPKEKIIFSSTCSRILPESVKRAGGIPLQDKVGHSFIKARMRKEHALLGIENTGHYMYKDNGYADSGIITALYVAALYSKEKKTMSARVKPLKKYYKSPEYNFSTTQGSEILKILAKRIRVLKPCSFHQKDGIHVECEDHWVSIRASQTEPFIRLVIEGTSQEIVMSTIQQYSEMIKSVLASQT